MVAVSSKEITLIVMINYGAFRTASFFMDTSFSLKQVSLLSLQHLIQLEM